MATELEYLRAVGSERNPAQETRYRELTGMNNAGTPTGLQVPNYQQYYDTAYSSLQAYYQRLLTEEGGNVERVKRRLEEDYQRGNRITMEDFVTKTAQSQEEYGANTKQEALVRQQEDRSLEDNLLSRGVSMGGLADSKNAEQKSRQELRREAIDRALKNTQQELAYGKERSMEESALTKLRGVEDVQSGWGSFQTRMGQEREEKALGLAEQSYQRDLQKRQAQEQSSLADRQLKLQEEALNKAYA